MPAEAGAITAEALWFTAPRSAELRGEVVLPPGPGEIRLQTVASAVSHGTELLVYRGQVPPGLPLDLPTLAGSFAFPIKYGYALVGRVLDVGAGTDDFKPGDLVFVHHPHQSALVVPVHPESGPAPVRLAAGSDPLRGLFVANLETAVNVLLDTPLRLGETALVFGLGTVGLLISQLLQHAGAGQVIAVEPLAVRRALAERLGVQTLTPGDDLPDRVRRLTDGRGADVAIEVSGAPPALQGAIDAVAVEGTVVVVSWYGIKPVSLTLGGHFHRGRVRLRSSQVGRIAPELSARWDPGRRLALVRDLLPQLRLTELISHRFPFRAAPAGYQLIDERPEEVVQVILTYGDHPSAEG